MQQAEHITESEVDIEKKKQELYSEIDALGIKSDSRINKLKKFLADRKIWHLEEMDYPLRNSYEQYLRGQIRSQIVSFYLKIYDTVKQQHIYQQMQTLEACRENKIANGEYLFQSHDYRHTVATMFYDSHVSLQSIRDYLGHTYEEMTRQYIDYMPQRIAKANDEFFEMQGSSLASWLKKEEKDGK